MAEVHLVVGCALILLNLAAFAVGGIAWFRDQASIPFWYLLRAAQVSVFLQVLLGGLLVFTGHKPARQPPLPLRDPPPGRLASSPRAPAPAPPSASSRDIDIDALPRRGPAGDGAGDRPPRDGDHGRQLRRDLLPRPPRRRHERRLLAVEGRVAAKWTALDRLSARCGRPGWSGAIRQQLLVAGVRADSVEEGADLPLPLLQVGTEDSAAFSASATSVALNSSLRRPATRRPPPTTRMFRTHCASPRGATR